MSETHSEQRKLWKGRGIFCKIRKQEEKFQKKYGKFTEDCIPDGVFPIGDDVFCLCKQSIMIPYQYT
ncbi:hypothetical protein TNCT_469961 [Trichonephila clavata]|uniref:Uncharacterized protein n=1 Tax=Trichonephila clavata TaxID=2740835 RepID=A0A8X6LJR4_TRICU|nr:hypothetical protein TNCT_469961 [Trichonephila clavata]